MLKLDEDARRYLDEVKAQATTFGPQALSSLERNLSFLDTYACPEDGSDPQATITHLFKDFSPLSFTFSITKRCKDGEYRQWFLGGLIYSGPGIPSNGGPTTAHFFVNYPVSNLPSRSVSLDPNAANGKKHLWSIHT